ncbi:MAG: hypothetical protein IPG20_06885 [Gammaproteobacteria bacterium]|nr:hypothetical protein [Gammaproteobacteria bacterium]
MPLGQGCTAEEQISGAARHGGIQIIVYPMKRDHDEEILKRSARVVDADVCYSLSTPCESASMGSARGGLMRQEIYEDEYGYDAWDITKPSRCFGLILSSAQWAIATGKPGPG